MSALAGGDHIGHVDALRAGGTGRVPGLAVEAASTVGTFLRSFRWGNVRQLDRVSRELSPVPGPRAPDLGTPRLTIDLDPAICETYGLRKQGAPRQGHAGVRGIVACSSDWAEQTAAGPGPTHSSSV